MLCAVSTRRPARAGSPPARLTLLVGSEEFLVGRAIRRVVAGARAVDPQVERRDVDAEDPDAIGLLQAALSPSLFGESAVVVVRGTAEAAEPVMAALLAGVADLADNTWVVVEHVGSRNKRSLDALRGASVPGGVAEVACAAVKKGELRGLLEREARAAGRRLTADGVDALVVALGTDVALLVGALEQLLADHPDDPIDAAVVSSTFSGVAQMPGYEMADAVWEARGLLALQRLRWGQASQTISGAGAVGAMAAGLRALVRVAGTPRGLPDAEVARLTGAPAFKVRSLRRLQVTWEPGALADAVVALAALDAQVKGGLGGTAGLEPAQKAHALESYVIATTGLRQRRADPGAGRPSGPR
jgi:DNA polymerase-3 subunit delta